ncbi:choice-of-anchor B family protein [Ornithinimicrobium cerasi]|uniref:Choice-of-anchor B domain-containing protein n=1 Tax=Ornithinimicrobium cerasi TaxID=2248773 RepID=A0A285VVA8_9MICO|nr:choice-of-anchor B family protein [Ornithinimicrobium cerasi]SOC57974.1 choice-of-anchor B domain-containing protein [Ornithinimicrobium cerasi]
MRSKLTVALGGLAAVAMMAATHVPVSAHPAHDLSNPGTMPLKGRTYDGVVDAVSPGGVPMEAMSDVRCEDGMAGIFPCHKVDLASFTPLPDMEATFVNDLWGWEDGQTGMQLAIVGTFEGTAFIDVTNGSDPVYLGTLESEVPGDSGNIWGDVRVYEDTAYIGSEAIDLGTYVPETGELEGFGVQVVDLTQFRGATGPIDVQLTNHIDDMTNSHNISLNEDSGRMYVVGAVYNLAVCGSPNPGFPVLNGNGGAIVYDVATDPNNPEFIGCLTEDGYSHDIQCVEYAGPDADYTGREICIGSNEDTVTIYDATDPEEPVLIDRLSYVDEEQAQDIYTHQGWLSEDQSFFFLGDELDEINGVVTERSTYIWDLTDLDDASLVGTHTDGNTSIDHNMFVKDSLLYQANYTSGLWIYDTWKKEQGRVQMRGFFDVFPADDRTEFYGSWGTYPYFGDGKVVVTSSDEGVFVLESRAKSSEGPATASRGRSQR